MNKSESIANLTAALCLAQAAFPVVPKVKEVIVQSSKGAYTFRYAPLEKMIEIVRPILAEHGLGFTQGAAGDMLETTIFHVSGEWITHNMPLHDPGTSQAYGAQFTYKRRYSLKAALGLETDDDNSEMGEDQPKKKGRILSGTITPNGDAMENVPKERKEYVTRVAGTVVPQRSRRPSWRS